MSEIINLYNGEMTIFNVLPYIILTIIRFYGDLWRTLFNIATVCQQDANDMNRVNAHLSWFATPFQKFSFFDFLVIDYY